jgi:hypothetical protein
MLTQLPEFGDRTLFMSDYLCIKDYVIQVDLRPVQLKVSLDEGSAISVNRVNVRYCLFLGCSSTDQSVDLRRARSIEERPKHILAIAKKISRAPANDYAWAVRKCVIDRQFGNSGDSARIKQFAPKEAPAGHKPRCSSKSGQLEYAWLCSSCTLYLTIQIDEEFGTRVVRKLEAKNGSQSGTLANDGTNTDIA